LTTAKLLRPRLVVALGLWVAAAACTSPDEQPTPEPVAPAPAAEAKPPVVTEYARQLAALDRVTGPSGPDADAVSDVRAMLKAQDLAASGESKAAVKQWFLALRVARGAFGQRALEHWLKAYTDDLQRTVDVAVLARLIMAETDGGRLSPYMLDKGLTTEAAITPVLAANCAKWLTAPSQPEAAPTALPAPPPAGLPAQDPLLVKTSALVCKAGRGAARSEPWTAWAQTLPAGLQEYWEALVWQCGGRGGDALATLKRIYPRLAEAGHPAQALEAASRVAALHRAIGQRTEAGNVYLDLMPLWERPGITPASMGLDAPTLALRRIDEALYAARYRALLGDYEHGKAFAQKALDVIAATNAKGGLKAQQRDQIAAFSAEAYHTLAFRIALERHEFDSAQSLSLLGLKTPHLPSEWRDRLTWFAALYDYLGGNYESARKRWAGLLDQTRDVDVKAATYFWLARALERLNRPDDAHFYAAALVEDFPLSYYAVVALPAGLQGFGGPDTDWRATFGDIGALRAKLDAPLDPGRARTHPSVAPLLRRAQLLADARVHSWQRVAVDELDKSMAAALSMSADPEAFLELTRLENAAGNYLRTIGILNKLAKNVDGFWRRYPERILATFPEPYGEYYDAAASAESVEKALLLAISRQESGFTADIRSSANAIGVMQLIKPTATRFAADMGLSTSSIEQDLANPAINIKLGSRYLKVLSLNYKGFPPAVYAGYNAGEFAVDLWLKRRAHTDPLMFVELVPFGETKDYVKNVWRNIVVYRHLMAHGVTAGVFDRAERATQCLAAVRP
jgi:soluble lytic murein transglycosylase-like protein